MSFHQDFYGAGGIEHQELADLAYQLQQVIRYTPKRTTPKRKGTATVKPDNKQLLKAKREILNIACNIVSRPSAFSRPISAHARAFNQSIRERALFAYGQDHSSLETRVDVANLLKEIGTAIEQLNFVSYEYDGLWQPEKRYDREHLLLDLLREEQRDFGIEANESAFMSISNRYKEREDRLTGTGAEGQVLNVDELISRDPGIGWTTNIQRCRVSDLFMLPTIPKKRPLEGDEAVEKKIEEDEDDETVVKQEDDDAMDLDNDDAKQQEVSQIIDLTGDDSMDEDFMDEDNKIMQKEQAERPVKRVRFEL